VALEPADRVHFYTDGVTEGRNLVGEPLVKPVWLTW
jgi:serine phosphatase RsbU (regulator of sigma subunit)